MGSIKWLGFWRLALALGVSLANPAPALDLRAGQTDEAVANADGAQQPYPCDACIGARLPFEPGRGVEAPGSNSLVMPVLRAQGSGELRNEGFTERFDPPNRHDWHIADYQFSHPDFDTDWERRNVRISAGATLRLRPQKNQDNGFAGASLRRTATSHFGRYEALMQPARGAGVVTGFFTYTGPYYGTRHDEIDIEFLGKDTRKLHLSWWVDGALNSHVVPLGFDAADGPRLYAFEWHPDRLRWFVEGRLLHEVRAESSALPAVPSYLFFNLWAADQRLQGWAGQTAEGTTAQARILSVTFTPLQDLLTGLPRSQTGDDRRYREDAERG
ncbi:family 16 glycosylhydrolase [Thalassovita sp.]|uniref:family 16 glycosylhydrolase n=1 Tax=Thalassovita sp. TaxID=1979401 RepID=UPI002AB004DC|nr:family 16 glycosylhydrolase [Thalassovita sp.]